MERFDLLNAPLCGVNLLEAGAGTGKTFNIEGLCLRLIIETALPIGEILVVTYTVAATEELRDRIRRRLRDAAAAFSSGNSADPLLTSMLVKFPDPRERLLFQERIRAALRDFDEAAIFTIHSFCQRILQENAFESDSLFDTELITDERRLREEIVEDFWRTHFYETLPELAGYALSCGFNPGYLKKLMGKVVFHSDMEIIPRNDPPSLEAIRDQIAAYNGALAGILKSWPGVREEIYGKLSDKALHAGTYGFRVGKLMKAMDAFVASGGGFPLFMDFEKFTAGKISEKLKKNQALPDHEFFHSCQNLKGLADVLEQDLDAFLLFLKREFLSTVMRKLAARKEKDNLMFFDDLLIRLRDALKNRGGEELAQIVGAKYKAALIDEFQDTDPVQFAIFRMVFGKGDHPLFLIGDPKQAIYSFRGADIFAYMKAAADIQGKYTIVENWRSEPGLIGAVNTLFSCRENPFLYKAISFRNAEAPPDKTPVFLTIDGKREAPFRWWFVPAEKYDESGKFLSKERAQQIIARAVATETVRLLTLSQQARAMIGEKPLQSSDIAVLVRKHLEARLLQETFRKFKIPSIIQKTGNIFDTREAEELERLLKGFAMPEEERLIRAALLTDMLGVGVEGVGKLAEDERAWGKWLDKFLFYHDLWFEAGFMQMFTAFMKEEDVKVRLLGFTDGERRLTNLLQLMEALHLKSEEQKFGVMALLKWFAEQRDPDTPRLEEHELRLESDERAVNIVTMHQSKGLEFPVVFCPFTWDGSEIREEGFSFHGKPGEELIVFDLGSADIASNRARAERELLAENVRLLYVALTRAKQRCYFIWGRFNRAGTSAPAYLFHYRQKEAGAGEQDGVVKAVAEDYKDLDDGAMYRQLGEIAMQAAGNIALGEIPAGAGDVALARHEEEQPLTFKSFSGKIDRSWRIVSFSSLTSDQPHGAENPDYDGALETGNLSPGDLTHDFRTSGEGEGAFPGPETPRDIFSFPRGARAGTLLHEILRYLDFQQADGQAARTLVSQKLHAYGFPSLWEEAVISLLRKVAVAPLEPFSGAGETGRPFALSSVSGSERLNELEFYFPLRRLIPEYLKNIFADAGYYPSANDAKKGNGPSWQDFFVEEGRLHFSPVRGFLKGFMDMVFCFGGRYYLVDWKSNFLGPTVSDYNQAALRSSMSDNFYVLQYHLYALALHLYLDRRLPGYRYEKDFGGVYYFFLRGVEPALGSEYGIYRQRPQEGVIMELAENLL